MTQTQAIGIVLFITSFLASQSDGVVTCPTAGYELTLDRLDQAEASTDEQVEEMMPAPVAQAFISLRRKDNFDIIREKMIGMVFTGKPQPLVSAVGLARYHII